MKLHTALLEFFLHEDQLYIFVVRQDIPELSIKDKEPVVMNCNLTLSEVTDIVSFLRNQLKEVIKNPTKERVDTSDLTPLNILGERIFSVELLDLLAEYESLYLVPFGPLHHIPLHACYVRGNFIMDLFVISYLPCASSLFFISKQKYVQEKPSLLSIGVDCTDSYNSFRDEAQQIFKLDYWADEPHSLALFKKNATKSNVLKHCDNKSVIHISTHGHFSENNPLSSGVLLYSEEYLKNPESINKYEESDLILDANSIIRDVKLNAEIVVMSACVTGESKHISGDELIGITRALLYAGARSLIVTQFNSFKNVTANLQKKEARFARFYDLWLGEGLPKSIAFQQYIQGIRKCKGFEHPFYWFQFIYIGSLR